MKINSLSDLKGCEIDVLGHQILARPFIVKEQVEEVEKEKNKPVILKPAEFTKKINGETHTIVTDAGKIHLLKVLKVGEALTNTKLQVGSIVRIRPQLPEDITDTLLSDIVGHPIAILSSMDVLAIISNTRIDGTIL